MCLAEPRHPLLGWLTTNCLLCGPTTVEPWGDLNLFSLCAHSDTKNHIHFPLRAAEWCASNINLSRGMTWQLVLSSATPQQNIPMDFMRSCQVGKRERWSNIQVLFFFFFSSYFIILSFLFLIFQSTWLQNRASRLDLTMPWLSWGSKLHWAQNKCAWKLHILNWWLHKIRNRGNADTFGLELGRAVKECGAVVANSSFCDLKGKGL